MTGKIFGSLLAGMFVAVLVLQVATVSAQGKKPVTGPSTSPVTSPITSPTACKPGWGFGDKNHCHSGPPGLIKKLLNLNFNNFKFPFGHGNH